MTAPRTSKVDRSVYGQEHSETSHLLEDPVIGRDVLELVSSAMYIDPMTVYREYVQNAADAIDEARHRGLLNESELGRIDISVDASTRTVRIRDNGSGIEWPDSLRRLTALGASLKRNMSARGFRGVGRLAGLGYAQELIFRSRTDGESFVSEVRWDCRRLKAAFRSTEIDKGVASLIREIVIAKRVDAGIFPARFFEVELRGIIRLRNDRLMSPVAIGEYLSQVAPVPFSPDFRFGSEITKALSPIVNLSNLAIHIEGIEGQIYRPYRDVFVGENKRTITFEDVQIVNVPGVDGDTAAVAWILHHDYEGAVPNGAFCKGLRLRSGNIQVGDHTLLEELFPEPRFNVWSVGEVHVVDRRISPNGRRDHFDQNAHLTNLLNQLTPTARDIARRCRTSSIRRKWLREFDLHRRTVKEKLEIVRQGSLPKAKRYALVSSVEPTLMQMEKIAGLAVLADDQPDELLAKVRRLRAQIASLALPGKQDISPLSAITPRQRSMYEQMFGLIYECSANRVAAKALVDRIIAKIKSEVDERSISTGSANRRNASQKSNYERAARKQRRVVPTKKKGI